MRRSDRERGREFAYAVIDQCQYGVMSITTGEETPYCIPLSLARVGDDLFFHCALQGRKLDLLRRCPQVCVCFVTGVQADYIARENNYTTYFRSALATGTAFEVTDPAQKAEALRALCEKLLPGYMEGFDAAVARSLSVTGVWGVHMDQAVGKEKARKG